MILTKKEIMNKLNVIHEQLGYNEEKMKFKDVGSSIMNENGKDENVDFLLFSSNSRIICYLKIKAVNKAFRNWIATKGYVLDNNPCLDSNRYTIDTDMHLKSFTVVPKEVMDRKYYISGLDTTENSCTRTFNGNFTD